MGDILLDDRANLPVMIRYLQFLLLGVLCKELVEMGVYVVVNQTKIVAHFVRVVCYMPELHFVERGIVRCDAWGILQELPIHIRLLPIGSEQGILIAVEYVLDSIKHSACICFYFAESPQGCCLSAQGIGLIAS